MRAPFYILSILIPILIIYPVFSQTSLSPVDSSIVWVIFKDKPDQSVAPRFPAKSLARRSAAGFRAIGWGDFPVAQSYIKQISNHGARCRQTVKWINAASFCVPNSQLDALRSLSFVKEISPVRRWTRLPDPDRQRPSLRKTRDMPGQYGQSYTQMNMVSIPDAHHYLAHYRQTTPGHGILIALFDSGFFTLHDCFTHVRNNNAIVADSDFVDHDGNVDDRDWNLDSHGTKTLALIAGYVPGIFVGAAWDARFLLARTENDFSETRIEEDNWAAALVWAESLGVDIVSSSVGYRTDFTDSLENYTYAQMDGRTAISSRAADSATQRGVIIVNAIGNESHNYPNIEFRTLTAPADVAGVVSAGGVMPEDSVIASFSSCGPTADGRMKPDLVAQATDIMAPDTRPDARSVYTYGNSGTSFAAPVVAGVCALIKQAQAGSNANTVKALLYNACRLSRHQIRPDNIYGRGIPDALLACLGASDVYVTARDSAGFAVKGAIISNSFGAAIGVTDSLGNTVLFIPQYSFPAGFTIQDSAKKKLQYFSVEKTPCRRLSYFNLNMSVIISVYDTTGNRIPSPTIYWKKTNESAFRITHPDSTGSVLIAYPFLESFEFYVRARRYYASDTITVSGEDANSRIAVYLIPNPGNSLQVYPTVIRASDKNARVVIEYVTPQDDPVYMNEPLNIYVRSANGTLIWQHTAFMNKLTPVIFNYQCRNEAGRTLLPGMYFIIVEAGGIKHIKKFLITG